MKKWSVLPTISVGKIAFLSTRSLVREMINLPYEEYLVSEYEENTMDVYENFHVMYDKDNRFNSILFFGDCEIFINNYRIYPSDANTTLDLLGGFEFDGYNYVNRELSIGIVVGEDEISIESVFFGCEKYFSYLS